MEEWGGREGGGGLGVGSGSWSRYADADAGFGMRCTVRCAVWVAGCRGAWEWDGGAETKVRQKGRNTSRVGATGRKGETGQSTLIRRDAPSVDQSFSGVCMHVCACVPACYASVRSELEIGSAPAGGRLCCRTRLFYFDRDERIYQQDEQQRYQQRKNKAVRVVNQQLHVLAGLTPRWLSVPSLGLGREASIAAWPVKRDSPGR